MVLRRTCWDLLVCPRRLMVLLMTMLLLFIVRVLCRFRRWWAVCIFLRCRWVLFIRLMMRLRLKIRLFLSVILRVMFRFDWFWVRCGLRCLWYVWVLYLYGTWENGVGGVLYLPLFRTPGHPRTPRIYCYAKDWPPVLHLYYCAGRARTRKGGSRVPLIAPKKVRRA